MLKAYYRYALRQGIIQIVDEKLDQGERDLEAKDAARKTTVLNAAHFLAEARNNLQTEQTVGNCFRKGGFTLWKEINYGNFEEETLPFHRDVNKREYEEWLNIDESSQTMALTTENEIVTAVQNLGDKEESEDDDKIDEPLPLIVLHSVRR